MKHILQILVVALIGALLGNVQCDSYCSTAHCTSFATDTMKHCHRQSHEHGRHESGCLRHHSELFNPKAESDSLNSAAGQIFQLSPPLVIPQAGLAAPTRELWIKVDLAPAPDSRVFLSLSVLRI